MPGINVIISKEVNLKWENCVKCYLPKGSLPKHINKIHYAMYEKTIILKKITTLFSIIDKTKRQVS